MKFVLIYIFFIIPYSLHSQITDTIYDSQGKTFLIKKSDNDSRNGYLLVYDPSLRILMKRIHYLNNSKVVFEDFEYETLNVIAEYEGYIEERKIIKDGVNKAYFKNNSGYIEEFYLNNLLNGRQTWYNRYGHIQAIYQYRNGVLNGPFIRYNDSTGYVIDNGIYENGSKVGLWLTYYSNKILKDSGYYINDVNFLNFDSKRSLFKINDKKNMLIQEIKANNFNLDSFLSIKGVKRKADSISFPLEIYFKDGIWKYYDNTGNLIEHELYFKGNLVKPF